MDSDIPAIVRRRVHTRANGERVVSFNSAEERQNENAPTVFAASEKPSIQCLHCGKVLWTSGVSVNVNACISAHLRYCHVYKDMQTGEADLEFKNELKSQAGTSRLFSSRRMFSTS